ncbi:MAG: FAD-dependent oxidoreductase, partial [Caulobacteraceae bacterium]
MPLHLVADAVPSLPRRKVAVVGSGVSGLSCAWLLAKDHDVILYEVDDRLGGHSNTVDAPSPGGPVAVDTGFIVFNEANYPNLTALLAHLKVPTKPALMSFVNGDGEGHQGRFGGDLQMGEQGGQVGIVGLVED